MTSGYNIAIIGATGIVGSTLLSILEERKFPVGKLYLVASHRSAGEICDFAGKPIMVQDLEHFDFSKTQLSFFCAGNAVSAEYAPKAAALGNIVIDKSSCFRYDADVPLIVPEVNPDHLVAYKKKNIIASPNCSTTPVAVALKPIHDAVGIARISVATYQSVSGSGKKGVSELAEQTSHLLNGKSVKPTLYSRQIAFNIIPVCDELQENGYTKEEMKIVWEIHKMFNDDSIAITPTAVRVPVFYGHSAAVHVETKEKIQLNKVIALLSKSPGIKLMSGTGKHPYPTPVNEATGHDDVYVGRLREDLFIPNGINLWVVTDNLRKGAALNAVQIAESLIEKHFLVHD